MKGRRNEGKKGCQNRPLLQAGFTRRQKAKMREVTTAQRVQKASGKRS